jgi:hypothetical protein
MLLHLYIKTYTQQYVLQYASAKWQYIAIRFFPYCYTPTKRIQSFTSYKLLGLNKYSLDKLARLTTDTDVS